MINIPRTTLCCIDCYNHELAIKALKKCMQLCRFEMVLFVTDKEYDIEDIAVITIPRITTKEQYSLFVIKELNNLILTDFVLLIQYDGYIVNPEAWTPVYQDCDYIGAKWWWYNDGFNVGNGGFSLRSKRLLQALSDNMISISPGSLQYGEDTFICRIYRRFLENNYKIKFASEPIADQFSHERSVPVGHPFGFHGLFNMWRYIKDEEFMNFVNLLSPKSLASIEAIELGMNYQKREKLEQAAIIYRKIVEYYPDHEDAQSLLKMINIS